MDKRSQVFSFFDMWEYEKKWRDKDKVIIAGTDEAGRGPLAGPVVAAAVVLDMNGKNIEGINDSKKLSEKKRESLFSQIVENCVCYSIKSASCEEIDEINILQASLLAMKRCVEALSVKPDVVLIDGSFTFDCGITTEAIVKGDSLSFSIAAASILAKVHRDKIMLEYDEIYPEYGFAAHKGYPTKRHFEAIERYGVLPIHRKSFNLTRRK